MRASWGVAEPGDPYWIVVGDAPPHLVEGGVIGPNGERVPDPVPYWRKPKRGKKMATVLTLLRVALLWVVGAGLLVALQFFVWGPWQDVPLWWAMVSGSCSVLWLLACIFLCHATEDEDERK